MKMLDMEELDSFKIENRFINCLLIDMFLNKIILNKPTIINS